MVANRVVSQLQKIEAVIRSPAIYELAELIPKREDGDAGRHRDFPDYVVFLFEALITIFTSARKVDTELGDRNMWRFIQRTIKKANKRNPERWLSSKRFTRHHYDYARNTYLANPELLEKIQEKQREIAIRQANEIGLLDESGEGSLTHPSLDRLLYSDGKVITPLYRAKPGDIKINKETGEIREVRYEPDADLHMQGDGEMAYGVKFVITAVRSPNVNERIILDARHCPEKGGEANTAMAAFKDIAPIAPGCVGTLYDTALRGKHHQELMRNYGWLSINRVTAKQVITRDGKPVKRTEKATHIEDRKINGRTVRFFAQNGALCVAELDHNGEQVLTECTRIQTIKRTNDDGTFRFYNSYLTPAGDEILMRLDITEQDKQRKLNRSENLRQIAPTDRDFKRLYGRRSDAESINRALDDTLWLRRAHSKGAARQAVNLIGFAIVTNAVACYLHEKRTSTESKSPPGAAAA